MKFRIVVGLVLAVVVSACATTPPPEPGPKPLTILISIDGFRPDYLNPTDAPTLSRLAAEGVVAPKGMAPSYPSVTFPNHYTLVTGLRPDHHGMVNNIMEDPEIPGVKFGMGNKEAVVDRRWWDQGEPIWVTAENAGIKTGTMFWPGSEADVHGVRPWRYSAFDQKMPGPARVDVLLGWIDDPAPDPGFVTLYFDIVDSAGHWFGPRSPEVKKAVSEVDAAIAHLVEGLKARGLDGKVNLVIVADHGMAEVLPGQTVIADAADPGGARMVSGGAIAGFQPVDGNVARAEALLLKPHDNMTCWRKGEIPKRLAYGTNPRVPAIVCMARVGWYISNVESTAARKPGTKVTGAHGYDNQDPSMAALFLAWGPSVRKGGTVSGLENVDVYPLLARMIGVTPKPNDGKFPKGVLR